MLTAENLQALKRPFKPNEHEFLNGNAYITESAITDRIEEIDPNWSFVIINEYTRDNQCICIARMTVSGVSRDGVGMQPLTIKLKKTGEIVDGTDPEKSAATDALKRCARLFGIGRYLLNLPDSVKDMGSLTKFLNGSANSQNATNSGATQSQVSTPQNAQKGLKTPNSVEWLASSVTVKVDRNNKQYLVYNCQEGKATGRGRDILRQAGYDCETWEAVDATYDLQPPAAVSVQKNGDYWNVLALKQAEVVF